MDGGRIDRLLINDVDSVAVSDRLREASEDVFVLFEDDRFLSNCFLRFSFLATEFGMAERGRER